ncbi:YitT family protein [bacterium]|uniref:YitT family protein n=1 Tax=Lachnospiraceae TaxID=186803 RepID=UPI002A2C47EB|nr:YitT family protein [bacterium]MDY2884458.1 YitT family protein [Bariatricus sp.]MCI7149022.1 YitT family protein [bacterium]MDD6515547.1 YitT family protein [bacterium]MDY4194081.1 YitT family protein [Bariatricus sp.]
MKNKFISYIMIIFGGTLTAAAFGLFVLPQGFVAGGVTGLSVILSGFMNLPLSWIVLAINLILFALGWIFAGKEFIFKTLIMTFLFPTLLELFGRITIFDALSADPFLSSLLAGCLLGIGSGLILRANGSSGGFDILGVVLNKKFQIPVSSVMYVCDFVIILYQSVSKPLLSTVYGIVVILCSSIMVNKIITQGESKVQLLIFSKERETIREHLLKTFDTGVTLLNAESGYQKEKAKVILTILPYNKVSSVKKMIYTVDPYAFTVINGVNYVGGRGYSIRR